MFDALAKSWAREQRSERWAGAFASMAIHLILIGWVVIVPAPTSIGRARHVTSIQMPPYVPLRDVRPPGLNTDLGEISVPWPSTVIADIPDLNSMVNIYAPPSGITWLQGAAWRLSPHEGSEPVVEALLDDPPEVLATPPVRYPPLLREAGIEGTVVLEFVVDTLGHAEPATIRIISSTQKQFEAPAREAILTSLYRPGRWRGQPVRALSLERVAFTIQR